MHEIAFLSDYVRPFSSQTPHNKMIEVTTTEQITKLVDEYDNFLFDCDGVMWLDYKLIPGVNKTIEMLIRKNKKFGFVSNNSSALRKTYVERFKALGIDLVTELMMFPTCYAAASYLQNHCKFPPKSKVWVLGEIGIREELENAGYIVLGCEDPKLDEAFDASNPLLVPDPDVKAVVVGSSKKFNFLRVATTLQYLLNPDVVFIGANVDRTYPGPNGMVLPAGGAVVHEMMYTSGRECINVGKPCSTLLQIILEEHPHFEYQKTLMIGDTLYTDIKFGNDGNLGGTLLVMTGGTSDEELKRVMAGRDDSMKPAYVIDSAASLAKAE